MHAYKKRFPSMSWEWMDGKCTAVICENAKGEEKKNKKERLFAIIYSNLKLKHFMMLLQYTAIDAVCFCGNWTSEISASFNFFSLLFFSFCIAHSYALREQNMKHKIKYLASFFLLFCKLFLSTFFPSLVFVERVTSNEKKNPISMRQL